MSEQKYTPEPWRFDSVEMKIKGFGDLHGRAVIANVSAKMDYARGRNTQYANGKRIVECVNALAGIENPAEWVEKMKQMEAGFVDTKLEDEEIDKMVDRIFESEISEKNRISNLQSENEQLKAELAKLKGE